jgi:hypothetical protein
MLRAAIQRLVLALVIGALSLFPLGLSASNVEAAPDARTVGDDSRYVVDEEAITDAYLANCEEQVTCEAWFETLTQEELDFVVYLMLNLPPTGDVEFELAGDTFAGMISVSSGGSVKYQHTVIFEARSAGITQYKYSIRQTWCSKNFVITGCLASWYLYLNPSTWTPTAQSGYRASGGTGYSSTTLVYNVTLHSWGLGNIYLAWCTTHSQTVASAAATGSSTAYISWWWNKCM